MFLGMLRTGCCRTAGKALQRRPGSVTLAARAADKDGKACHAIIWSACQTCLCSLWKKKNFAGYFLRLEETQLNKSEKTQSPKIKIRDFQRMRINLSIQSKDVVTKTWTFMALVNSGSGAPMSESPFNGWLLKKTFSLSTQGVAQVPRWHLNPLHFHGEKYLQFTAAAVFHLHFPSPGYQIYLRSAFPLWKGSKEARLAWVEDGGETLWRVNFRIKRTLKPVFKVDFDSDGGHSERKKNHEILKILLL